jgi:hypothetical protein
MQSACPFQSEDMRVDSRSRPSSLSKADCIQACGAPHADACLNCTPRFWHDSAIVGSLRPETHTAGRVRDKGPVLQPGPLCWRPPRRWRAPEQMGRGWQNDCAGPSGAARRRRRRPSTSGRGRARRLRLRPRARGVGLNRRHRALLVEGREALDRLDANTTTDGSSI